MTTDAAPPAPLEDHRVSAIERYGPRIVGLLVAAFTVGGLYSRADARIAKVEDTIVTRGEMIARLNSLLEKQGQRQARMEKNIALIVCEQKPIQCKEAMAGIGE